MILNPDCVRDILLLTELTTEPNVKLIFDPDDAPKQLCNYTSSEIKYHVIQCKLNDFFISCIQDTVGNINITDLSPKGHEFLNNMRKDTIWNKTKSIGSKIGATSLNAFIQISSNVITEIIKSELKIGL